MVDRRQTAVWVVKLQGFPGEFDEVAAVFADHDGAGAYAAWWNRLESLRFRCESTASAVIEEVDFYSPGSWREPARPRAAANDGG